MKQIAYKFVTAQVPDKTLVDAFPDPLPQEKNEFADFFLVKNDRHHRYRVHFSFVRVGSAIMKNTTPKILADQNRKMWIDNATDVKVERMRLYSSGLNAEMITKRVNGFYVVNLVAHNRDTFGTIQWRQLNERYPSDEILLVGHSVKFIRVR